MRIDVHGHLGSPPAREFGTPHALVAYADACRLDAIFVSNFDAAEHAGDLDEPDANLACLDACAGHRQLAPLYTIRPGKPDSNLHALAGALDVEPFVGVFFAPHHAGIPADDPRLERYLPVIARQNRALFILASRDDYARPERIAALARRNPRLVVVLCLAADCPWDDAVSAVRRSQKNEDASLRLTTGSASLADIAAAVELLGPRALLLGTDAASSADHAERVARFLDQLAGRVSEADFAAIVGENARTLAPLRK